MLRNRNRWKLGLVLASVFISTAPLAQQIAWRKEGATQKDFDRDAAKCRIEAARIFAPQKAAIVNQPAPQQMAGNVVIRQSPLEGAARLAQIASLNQQEAAMVVDCMKASDWEAVVVK